MRDNHLADAPRRRFVCETPDPSALIVDQPFEMDTCKTLRMNTKGALTEGYGFTLRPNGRTGSELVSEPIIANIRYARVVVRKVHKTLEILPSFLPSRILENSTAHGEAPTLLRIRHQTEATWTLFLTGVTPAIPTASIMWGSHPRGLQGTDAGTKGDIRREFVFDANHPK